MLPYKALTVLANLKRELLDRKPDVPNEQIATFTARDEQKRKTPERTMRGARKRSMSFQRMCQRREW